MSEVGCPESGSGDPILHSIELEVSQHSGLAAVEPIWRIRIRGVVIGVIHPFVGYAAKRPATG
jgi:hypothetical protein